MTKTENTTNTNRLLFFLLLGFAVILALNLVAVSYPFFIVLPMLKALFLILVNVIYGFALPRLFGKNREETLDSAFALGLIVTTFFFFLLGEFKLLVTPLILSYLLLPLPILWWILQKQKRIFFETLQNFLHRPAIEYLVFLFPLIYVSLPTFNYDTLASYLGFPNLYVQNSGFVATPALLYPRPFIYSDVFYIPAVFAGEMVPQLFHWFVGLILFLAVINFAVDYFKMTRRIILLLTIVSLPTTIFLITRVNHDLTGILFVFLGVVSYLKDKKYLSALFWGFALGLEYFNILPLVIFLLWQMRVAIKEKRLAAFMRQMVFMGLILLVLLTPLLLKNHVFYGNISSPQVWYSAFILLAIYGVRAYESLEGRARHVFTVLFFMVVGLSTMNTFGKLEHVTGSHELYTGKIGIAEYKSQNFPAYKGITFVNNNTPPTSHILMLGEARSYDLKRRYTISSGYNHDILKQYLGKSVSPQEFAKRLKGNGIDYIIFDLKEFLHLQNRYNRLTRAECKQTITFLNGLPVLFHDGEVFVLGPF